MSKRKKIRKIYQKMDIRVGEDVINSILEDKEKLKNMMRLYKDEEIDSMNYIFGKPYDNKYFTEFELEAAQKIDLFDRNVINICKIIWENRKDEKKLENFMKQLEESRCCEC